MPAPSPIAPPKPLGLYQSTHFSRAKHTAAGLLLLMVSAPILAAQKLSVPPTPWLPPPAPNTSACALS